MAGKPVKLVSWPKLVIMIMAGLIGAGYKVTKKYYETGIIESNEVIISIIVFFICLAILLLITRHANKPEGLK